MSITKTFYSVTTAIDSNGKLESVTVSSEFSEDKRMNGCWAAPGGGDIFMDWFDTRSEAEAHARDMKASVEGWKK